MQKVAYEVEVTGTGLDGQPFGPAGRRVWWGNLGGTSGPAIGIGADYLLKLVEANQDPSGELDAKLTAIVNDVAQPPKVYKINMAGLRAIQYAQHKAEGRLLDATWKHQEKKAKKHGKNLSPPAPVPEPPAFPGGQ